VQGYGVATWNWLRAATDDPGFCAVGDLIAAARDAAGDSHRFRVIQLPFNMALTEALLLRNQPPPTGRTKASALDVCSQYGLAVMASVPLAQGQLASHTARFPAGLFPGLASPAQIALQFSRSAPGVTTAVVGMKDRRHIEENMQLARLPPATDSIAAALADL
jgi:aryl-alcohol dehydrogenase-like predicted oxidoreductase